MAARAAGACPAVAAASGSAGTGRAAPDVTGGTASVIGAARVAAVFASPA